MDFFEQKRQHSVVFFMAIFQTKCSGKVQCAALNGIKRSSTKRSCHHLDIK